MSFLTSNSVGSVIPDSAAHQWKYDEGSGTTISDSIGSVTGSLTDGTWTSDANAVGNYMMSFDGTNDRTDFTLDPTQYSEFLYAVTIQTSSGSALSSEHPVLSWDESGSLGEIELHDDPLNWKVGDGSNNPNCEATTDVYDGNKHRVAVKLKENDEVAIWVDTNKENSVSYATYGPVNSDHYHAYLARQDNYAKFDIDNPIFYTDSTQSTVDKDYNSQPWT